VTEGVGVNRRLRRGRQPADQLLGERLCIFRREGVQLKRTKLEEQGRLVIMHDVLGRADG